MSELTTVDRFRLFCATVFLWLTTRIMPSTCAVRIERKSPVIEALETTYYTVVYGVTGGREPHNEWWRKVSNTFADNEHIKVVASARMRWPR